MKKLLILGSGTAGTIMANKMRRSLKVSDWDITVLDKKDKHYYQPSQIFIPFQLYGYDDDKGCVHDSQDFIPKNVQLVITEITKIDPDKHQVETRNGTYDYDWLVVTLGCRIAPEEIPGMVEGYGKNVHYFYTMKSALEMQKALKDFDGGKLVLNVAEYPIKCPVAPIEFACLAHYYFELRGIRDKVELEVVTSMDGIFSKPVSSKILGDMLIDRGIKIVPSFNLSEVDSEKGIIRSYEGKEVKYDFLAAIPPNLGPQVIEDSGLGDGSGYVPTNPNTLKADHHDNIYVMGDCSNVKTSKAGSVAHFEAGIVAENLLREIHGMEPHPDFDGHSNCFIETGYHKAHLIDFSYLQEPVPGKLPFSFIGPFSLLKETRLNHWGKLFFRWYYWNILLKDRYSKPMEYFLPSRMSSRGKRKSYMAKSSA